MVCVASPRDVCLTHVVESESVSCSVCQTLCNPMDCSCQASLSMGFPREEYWSGYLRRHESLTLTLLHTTRCFKLMVSVSSVTQLCPTLYDPMNHSTSGLPVHHQLPEFTQTYAHRVGDAIQPSHPLSPPSPPAPNPSQYQGLFQWVNSSHEVPKVLGVSASASVLPMNTQDWSPSGWTGWISLQSEGLSRVFSNTIVKKHQFFGAQLSSQSNSHVHTWPLEKP